MRTIAKFGKPEVRPQLKDMHKIKCRVTLDRPDGWSGGWYHNEDLCPQRIRPQQEGGGVMFWAAIIGNELVGPFRVADGVKIIAKLYIDSIKEHLEPWHKKKNLALHPLFLVHILQLRADLWLSKFCNLPHDTASS